MDKKFIEYEDPIDSFPQQEARIPLAMPGRYLGFNFMVADGNGSGDIPVRIGHYEKSTKFVSGGKRFSNKANNLELNGTLLTCQGVVHNSIIDNPLTEGIPLSFPKNLTSESIYYLFFGKYSWVGQPGGSVVEYGITAFNPTDLPDPDLYEYITNKNTEFPIGYFEVAPGAIDIASVKYFPMNTPKFGWSDEDYFDKSLYAKLFEYNTFRETNYCAKQNLTAADNYSHNILVFDDTKGNILDFQSGNTAVYGIYAINSQLGANPSTHGLFFLTFSQLLGGSTIITGHGNIILPPHMGEYTGGVQVVKVFEGQTLVLLKTQNTAGQIVWQLLNIYPEYNEQKGWIDMEPITLPNPYLEFDYLEYIEDPYTGDVRVRAQIAYKHTGGVVTGTWNDVAKTNLPFTYDKVGAQHAIGIGEYTVNSLSNPPNPNISYPDRLPIALLVVVPGNTIDLIVQDLPEGTFIFPEFTLSKT